MVNPPAGPGQRHAAPRPGRHADVGPPPRTAARREWPRRSRPPPESCVRGRGVLSCTDDHTRSPRHVAHAVGGCAPARRPAGAGRALVQA
ncbi:hypothetical protein DLJ59_23805 [Micromonospora inaquosa]|uniref:Uncharacterized protein n=1 Tax=Micromonospora inaquosa TaxID=2203716 RepID=A0A3N9X056_9ACTN|nr:hypothetical protein DLJ59_23805 [Micromonospora inaquosa]